MLGVLLNARNIRKCTVKKKKNNCFLLFHRTYCNRSTIVSIIFQREFNIFPFMFTCNNITRVYNKL